MNGIYYFTFSGLTGSTGYVAVQFYVNDEGKLIFHDGDEAQHANLSFTWTYILEAGDKVKLKVTSGKLHASSSYRLYFNGYLIKSA